jgi:hypothetical protein
LKRLALDQADNVVFAQAFFEKACGQAVFLKDLGAANFIYIIK